MRIFAADPQPPDCPPESIVLVVEFPTHDQDNTVARPVLVDTIQNGDITDRRTGYADRRTRAGSVFAVPALDGICAPRGMDDCLLFHNDRFHPPDDEVEIQYGNYMTVHHTTFQVRYAAYLHRFPRAQQFVRDFLWRCTHFGIQDYWLNVHFTSGRLGERHHPNILAWSRAHCRDIPSLLTEVTAEWAHQGADHRSTLIVVSPQSALQNDQSTIHLILTAAQIPNWVPVLFSVYVHFDGMRAQKVETHAWTLPPQGPIVDYIHLIGYGEFVRSLAISHHISLGRTRFEGEETLLNLQTGGNYALHIHLQSVVDFVAATARHLVNTRPLNDTSSDDVEDASMIQVSQQLTRKNRGEKIDARLLDSANGAEMALGEFVYPLPRTIGEAIRQPRVLRLFPDWQELCSVMSVRDQHIGERTTQVAIYSQLAVIQAVQHLWQDEILGRSFQIFVLNPQPADLPVHSVGLLVEILTGSTDVDYYVPVLIDVLQHSLAHSDYDLTTKTTYIPRRAAVHDIFATTPAGQHCQPGGQFWCAADFQGRTVDVPHERVWPRAGNYIMLLVMPFQWYQHDYSNGLHGAAAFARDLQAHIFDVSDPFVFVRSHGVNQQNAPLGQRSLMLHRRLFGEAGLIWNIVGNLWSDILNVDRMRLIHVPPTPQLSHEPYAQLVAIEDPAPGHIPVLLTFFQQFESREPNHTGTFAQQTRIPARLMALTQTLGRTQGLPGGLAHSRVWCEDRYFDPQDTLPVEPGSHILVYVPPQQSPCEETGEEEDCVSDVTVGSEEHNDEESEEECDAEETDCTPETSSDPASSLEVGEIDDDPSSAPSPPDRGQTQRQSCCGVTHTAVLFLPWIIQQEQGWISFLPLFAVMMISNLGCPQPHVFDLWCVVGNPFADHLSDGILPLCTGSAMYDAFSRLPPPGNGPDTMLQFMSQLDTLDDYVAYEWGTCIYDYVEHVPNNQDIRPSFHVKMPDIGHIMDYLVGLVHGDFPRHYLMQCIDEFEDDLHPAIHTLDQGHGGDLQELQIYTDGSFGHCQQGNLETGCAFAVFGCTTEGAHVIHMATVRLVLQDDEAGWTGANTHGARQGEIEALIRASLWLLGSHYERPTTFYFDSQAAGFTGFGFWKIAPHDRHLRCLRAITQTLQTFMSNRPQGEHVKAHTGIVGNEVVNLLAQHAMKFGTTFGTARFEISDYLQGHRMPIEYMWLYALEMQNREQAFPEVHGDCIADRFPSNTPTVETAFPKALKGRILRKASTSQTSITLASYNVGTLDRCVTGPQSDNDLRGHEYLRRQAVDHAIDILCLQETRAKEDRLQESTTHIRVISAAHQGKGGTEIWLAKLDGKQRPIKLTRQDVLTLHSSAELLICRVRMAHGQYLVVSGHAPHSAYPQETVKAWWTDLTNMLQEFYLPGKEWILVGVDANAHFMVESLPHVGTHGLEQRENHGAQCFLDFLSAFALYLPSTYVDQHQGDTQTWIKVGQNYGTRCDYVAIPLEWTNNVHSSYVAPTLDAGTMMADHYPVVVWIKLQYTKRRVEQCQYDVTKIRNIQHLAYQTVVDKLQAIDWQCDVHSHAAQVSDTISEWLQEQCPRQATTPKKTYIQERTWGLRSVRISLTRLYKGLGRLYVKFQIQTALRARRSRTTYSQEWMSQTEKLVQYIAWSDRHVHY